MEVDKSGTIKLIRCLNNNGACPSVASLFKSIAKEYGKDSIGIILTGMGKDGAKELKILRNVGATTIAQDKYSALVNGMPGEAVKLDAAKHILDSEGIADFLKKIEAQFPKVQNNIRYNINGG
jgi:two-component system chemotaxis response regulator CheB